MKIEYDRSACGAWFQCVQKWDSFEMNVVEGKADLRDAEEGDDGLWMRTIPAHDEAAAIAAAGSCPVDAITIVDDEGNQIVP